ncbi:uncharacterized protein HMPREF1541_07119 [Cyphellophora europaea CBS 101466]|uniref:Arrestin-like N-terminal domain-containing protein n=1 Tax=Cyphellophora europaea (strain CBS 101466) TaxID=1220924 RepID=W2RM00_CYPE1|nr:uncharacterized protein HMPREF1541_07119 [Cyphellophora europaea CBS 101466]ETN37497.1 hypothetical protein HMPREF1541_07119 [Cyphellophora europaea CBS 101466]
MSLSVELPTAVSHAYRSGDTVCGTVTLGVDHGGMIESVAIILSGCTSTNACPVSGNIASRPTASQSKCLLFRQHILLRGPGWCQKGTSAWPFTFTIPQHSSFELAEDSNPHPTGNSPWRSAWDAESYPLPPSMRYIGSFSCSVEYTLLARVIRPPQAHLFGNEDLTVRLPIRFRPQAPLGSSLPPAALEEASVFYLKIPLKQRQSAAMKIMGGRGHTDKAVLEDRRSEDVVVFGVNVPVRLNVRNWAANIVSVFATSTIPSPEKQQLFVKNYRLQLMIHTKVRAGGLPYSKVDTIVLAEGSLAVPVKAEHRCVTDANDGLHHSTDSPTAISFLNVHREVRDLPPEFSSSSIFRAYTLSFRSQLRFGDIKSTFDQSQIPISLVDGEDRERRPSLMTVDPHEAPPSYEGRSH